MKIVAGEKDTMGKIINFVFIFYFFIIIILLYFVFGY